jgi:hypothetical protein
MRFAAVLIALCMLVPAGALAAEPADGAVEFWAVLVKGDVAALEKHYADTVLLKAGSELLKAQWGINPSGDRSQDRKVARADLMKGYKALISKVGVEKWQGIFGAVKKDKISTRVLKNKHVVLTVKTGPGDDYIEFELAPDKAGKRWRVVSEYTDY